MLISVVAILPPNMTAQIRVVFEILRFLLFSSKFSKKHVKKFQNFETLLILLFESLRALYVGVGNVASEFL